MAPKKLTDVQAKALDEADSILERAFNEASGRVRAQREPGEPDPGGFARCLRCDCESYVAPTGSSGHTSLSCKRPGCGHSFFSHDVF